jgi:site-specific recombinase XerC
MLLLSPAENALKGKRDRATLGMLLGCGLRREELVSLNVENVQLRDERWVIPHLVGKGTDSPGAGVGERTPKTLKAANLVVVDQDAKPTL